jgi:hypothetical protein
MKEIDKIINKIDKEIKKDSKQIDEMEKNKQIDNNIAYSSIKKRIRQNEITKKRYIVANKGKQAIYESIYSFLNADNLTADEKKQMYNTLKALNINYTLFINRNPLLEDYDKWFYIVAKYIGIILEKNDFKGDEFFDIDCNELFSYDLKKITYDITNNNIRKEKDNVRSIYYKKGLVICILRDKLIKQKCRICNKYPDITIDIIIDEFMTKKEVDEYLKNL